MKFSHDLFPQRINDKFGVPEMHKDIYLDLLDAQANGRSKMDRLHVIAAPREHSKSTITSYIYTLYCILFQLKHFIVLISESYPKTLQFVRQIKKALASPLVQQYFGNVRAENVSLDGLKWTEGHIVTATGINVMALGMGKSARGLIEDTRPDLIIADDIESENNTKTQDSRDANYGWWKAQVVPACDMIGGQCVYIGTMVHYDCTLGRLLEQKSYRKHFYQVWLDEQRTKTLWPEKFPPWLVKQIEEEYREDDRRGASLFYMEYMNVAVAPSERIFGPSAIIEKDYAFIKSPAGKWIEDEGVYRYVETFIGIDPAISRNDKACFTVILVLAVTREGKFYVVDYARGRFDIRQDDDTGRKGTIEETVRLVQQYRPERVGIEVSGLGQPIANELRREIEDLIASDPEVGYPMLVELRPPPTMAKEERIENVLASPYKLRKVTQRATMTGLKEELETFPKSKTLDALDALSNAVSISHVPYNDIEYDKRVEHGLPTALQPGQTTNRRILDWEIL